MNIKNFFKMYTAKNSKKGFTMVEMITVIIIMAIASTATLSVFLAVQTTVRDTGDITTQQFNTTQVEKFVRDQFQTASDVDVYDLLGGEPNFEASGHDIVENDEFMYYKAPDDTSDPNAKGTIYFCRYDSAGNANPVLTISEVEEVSIAVCPLDYASGTAGTTGDMPLKLIYKIKSKTYTYSGGIVLGNTAVGADDNLVSYNALEPENKNNVSIKWNPTSLDNNRCITFHAAVSEVSGTTP